MNLYDPEFDDSPPKKPSSFGGQKRKYEEEEYEHRTAPFSGFMTAGLQKKITVSDKALQKARRTLASDLDFVIKPSSFKDEIGISTVENSASSLVQHEGKHSTDSIERHSISPSVNVDINVSSYISNRIIEEDGNDLIEQKKEENEEKQGSLPVLSSAFKEFITSDSSEKEVERSREILEKAEHIICNDDDITNKNMKEEESVAQAVSSSFNGFMTAGSNRKIEVSTSALQKARQKLGINEEYVTNEDKGSGPLSSDILTSFAGFATAGKNIRIEVSDSALIAARRRINDEENCEEMKTEIFTTPKTTRIIPVFNDNTSLEINKSKLKPKGFISPFVGTSKRTASPSNFTSPLTSIPRSSTARRFSTPFRSPVLLSSPNTSNTSHIASILNIPIAKGTVESCSPSTTSETSIDSNQISPEQFPISSLRCIGLLSTLMISERKFILKASISDIKYFDKVTYLGCENCKKKMIIDEQGESRCTRCSQRETKNYYRLEAELMDFSGVLRVIIFDDVAKRLINEDADDMAKMLKYKPDDARIKLSSLYFRPKLFRVSYRDSQWTIDDYRNIDYQIFNQFLLNTVKKKGCTEFST